MPISKVTYDPISLLVDGKRLFLYSGEIHYFRTDAEQWRDSLRKIKAANLNSISTYIPWNWHEVSEGDLDFTGRTHPRRNLVGFLELVQEMGLYVIFRPGPYICSEWLNGGIPNWLLKKHPEILALDSKGKPAVDYGLYYPPISYAHPTYLNYVARWYQNVFSVARPFLYTNGGNIINIQLDDEQSYWRTIMENPLLADYNPAVIGDRTHENRFGSWLERKYYGGIGELNQIYRLSYKNFLDVHPPYQPIQDCKDLPFFLDWYGFKLSEVDEYIKKLYELLIKENVDVTISALDQYLSSNLAWPKFTRFIQKNKLNIIHTGQYYSAPLFEISDMREDKLGSLVANHELYKTGIKGAGTPPIMMEIQSAMSAHMTGPEMEEMYHLSVAQGINGLNFYMIAGGENHPDFVLSNGHSYDISAPIGYKGQLRQHYSTIQELGAYLQFLGEDFLQSSTVYDIGVGFYEPYEACSIQGNTLDLGFRDDYQSIFREYYQYHICSPRGFDFFSLLTHSGVSFSMEDLEGITDADLLKIKQLWVLGLDFMARGVQQKLVDYIEGGGCLVLFPQVPTLDEFMQPCGLLKNLVGCSPIQPERARRPGEPPNFRSINFGNREGVLIFDYVDQFEPPADAKIISRENRTNKVCAFSRNAGKGKVVLIGFKLKYVWDAHLDHKAFIHYILDEAKVDRAAFSSTDEMVVKERIYKDKGYLTVINPNNLTNSSKITYTEPGTGDRKVLPNLAEELTYTRQGGTLMLLNLELPSLDGKMLYCTAEIVAFVSRDHILELTIREEKSAYAEIALQAPGQISATVDGTAIDVHMLNGIYYLPLELSKSIISIRIEQQDQK